MHATTTFIVAGSDEEDDNDNKSDKSDDDNEQGAQDKGQSRDRSTPQPEGADPQPKSDGQQEEEQQQQKKKHTRQDWEARIAELPLRSEPVGLDRHHRKYWLLSGLSPPRYMMRETLTQRVLCALAHRLVLHMLWHVVPGGSTGACCISV